MSLRLLAAMSAPSAKALPLSPGLFRGMGGRWRAANALVDGGNTVSKIVGGGFGGVGGREDQRIDRALHWIAPTL